MNAAQRRREAKRLRKRGLSYAAIGAALGVTGPTAWRYCHDRYGAQGKTPNGPSHQDNAALKERAREMRANGMTIMRIAALLDVHLNTARNYLKEEQP